MDTFVIDTLIQITRRFIVLGHHGHYSIRKRGGKAVRNVSFFLFSEQYPFKYVFIYIERKTQSYTRNTKVNSSTAMNNKDVVTNLRVCKLYGVKSFTAYLLRQYHDDRGMTQTTNTTQLHSLYRYSDEVHSGFSASTVLVDAPVRYVGWNSLFRMEPTSPKCMNVTIGIYRNIYIQPTRIKYKYLPFIPICYNSFQYIQPFMLDGHKTPIDLLQRHP
jgi:hypothetical protein